MKKVIFLLIMIVLSSCDKFLDKKPDMSIAIPESIGDIRAILDNQSGINDNFPGLLEIGADDYFVDYTVLRSRPVRDQALYVWDGGEDTYHLPSWNQSYSAVMTSNVVLESIERLRDGAQSNELDQFKGEALFIRGFRHFLLAQLYAQSYDPNGINQGLGIPYRMTADLNVASVRLTVEESYNLIVQDLEEAVKFLPEYPAGITRPSKAAAYAALARVYLSMENYDKALLMAEEALSRRSELLDYNTIDLNLSIPFGITTNSELIYYAHTTGAATFLLPTRGNVDTVLVNSYDEDDLRSKLFFQPKSNGYHSFKGHYTGHQSNIFMGLATDELYLIRSECYARLNQLGLALKDLNTLLKNRWATGKYRDYTTISRDDLMDRILSERRKQLVFRGVRWGDLKRLNRYDRYQKTLLRRINDGIQIDEYTLLPNDLRYIQLIPREVIERSGMAQNER